MKNKSKRLVIACLFLSGSALAQDNVNRYSIQDAMATSDAKEELDLEYTFKFAAEPYGAVFIQHGEFMVEETSSVFLKTDPEACNAAFLAAMLSFQDRIYKEGANAVVNIRSYYNDNEISSETEFECGRGTMNVGVAFKGDVVSLK